MSGDIHIQAFVYDRQEIGQGFRSGVVEVGDVTLMFMEDNPLPQMEALRDELDRQIDTIKAQRAAPVSAPADPPPIPLNAPIERVVGPHYMVPGESIVINDPSREHGPGCTCILCDIPF